MTNTCFVTIVDDFLQQSLNRWTWSSTNKVQPVHVNQCGILHMFFNYIGVRSLQIGANSKHFNLRLMYEFYQDQTSISSENNSDHRLQRRLLNDEKYVKYHIDWRGIKLPLSGLEWSQQTVYTVVSLPYRCVLNIKYFKRVLILINLAFHALHLMTNKLLVRVCSCQDQVVTT